MKQFVVVLAPWLFACSAVAQSTPAGSGSTIRATSTEVLLDLIVRDKHGKPVKNLKAGEVEIFEDGVRQEIKSFRFVGTRDTLQKDAASVSAPPASAARSLRAVNVVPIVFHNIDPIFRRNAIEAVQEFLGRDLQGDTYFGVFNLDDRLNALFPFTANRSDVIKAVQTAFTLRPMDFTRASEALLTASPNRQNISVAVNMAAHTAAVSFSVTGGQVSKTSVAGADVSTGAGANALRGDQVAERTTFANISGMRETDKINTMIEQLGSLPGRKTVLLVTTGLLTTGDPERFQALLDKATRSSVTVYPIDITGLQENSTSQAAKLKLGDVAGVSRSQAEVTTNLGIMKEKSLQNDNMELAVRASDTQASLRELAEGSGGFLIANTNDFRKSFQRIVEDVQSHYEAIYKPSADKFDGRLRKIEVKLARPELTVENRTGYFGIPDLKGLPALQPFEILALGALSADPLPHAFDFHASAFHFPSATALVLELPGTSLQPVPNPERKTQFLHASVLAVIKDNSGQIVDKFSIDAPYEIPEANLAAVRSTPITYMHPLRLPPGKYTVEAAVLDREGGRSSTTVFPYDNPVHTQHIDLSSVILVQRIEPGGSQIDPADPLIYRGNRIVPLIAPSVAGDAKPFVYFVVYPGAAAAEKPKIEVEFLVGGKSTAKQVADLPDPDASGAIPMVVRAAMHPGKCELKITALQGGESVTRSIAYTVTAR